MIRKIFLLGLIFVSVFSCSRNIIIENIIEQYDDGGRKVVHYYQEKRNGDQVWVGETWFYQEGMKHLEGPIEDGKRNGDFKTYYKSGTLMSEGTFVDGISSFTGHLFLHKFHIIAVDCGNAGDFAGNAFAGLKCRKREFHLP